MKAIDVTAVTAKYMLAYRPAQKYADADSVITKIPFDIKSTKEINTPDANVGGSSPPHE